VSEKEVESGHPEEQKQGIRSSILRKIDVVGHQCQREGAGNGDGMRKLSSEEIDHGDGESSKDERNDPKVSLWFGEWVELVSKDKK